MILDLPGLELERCGQLTTLSARIERLGNDKLADAAAQQCVSPHVALGGQKLKELERSPHIASRDGVEEVPGLNLGRTYNPALNVGKLNLGRLDHLGKLSQVVIEHASVFTRTRDEFLGGRRRDRLAVLRRHLLHTAR